MSSTPRPEPGEHPPIPTPIPDFLFPNSKNTKCKALESCAYVAGTLRDYSTGVTLDICAVNKHSIRKASIRPPKSIGALVP